MKKLLSWQKKALTLALTSYAGDGKVDLRKVDLRKWPDLPPECLAYLASLHSPSVRTFIGIHHYSLLRELESPAVMAFTEAIENRDWPFNQGYFLKEQTLTFGIFSDREWRCLLRKYSIRRLCMELGDGTTLLVYVPPWSRVRHGQIRKCLQAQQLASAVRGDRPFGPMTY